LKTTISTHNSAVKLLLLKGGNSCHLSWN